ncbi:hypothetical protein YC2023_033984 [Brassica napus]
MSSSSSKKQTLFISTLIISWYSSNIGVLLLNKFLLSNYGFKFPIFLTMCHMSACAILSYVSIVFLKLVPLQHLKSRSQFLKVATLSIVFCASVVGGNISLRYLPLREAWVTYGALVPVVAGVVIASGILLVVIMPMFDLNEVSKTLTKGENLKKLYQVVLVVSCLIFDLRSKHHSLYCRGSQGFTGLVSLCALVLLRQELLNLEKLNSMNLMLYMSSIAVVALLPVTLVMEPDVISLTLALAKQHQYMWILLLVNSVMAYSANLLNFLVTKHTSALTLQVLGNAKGAVAVVISILIFQNPVTVMEPGYGYGYWRVFHNGPWGGCLRRDKTQV